MSLMFFCALSLDASRYRSYLQGIFNFFNPAEDFIEIKVETFVRDKTVDSFSTIQQSSAPKQTVSKEEN